MQPDMIEPAVFAASTRALLMEDARRYRNFGAFWWFVKALMARYYDADNLYFLRGYEPPDAAALIPSDIPPADMLQAAAETYQMNATLNLGSNLVADRDGEGLWLFDPDVET